MSSFFVHTTSPCLMLARPVAATKLEDWAAARFQPSAFSTQHLFCFQWLLRNFFAKCKEVTEKEFIRWIRGQQIAHILRPLHYHTNPSRRYLSMKERDVRIGNAVPNFIRL